jgi:hypothetical protein
VREDERGVWQAASQSGVRDGRGRGRGMEPQGLHSLVGGRAGMRFGVGARRRRLREDGILTRYIVVSLRLVTSPPFPSTFPAPRSVFLASFASSYLPSFIPVSILSLSMLYPCRTPCRTTSLSSMQISDSYPRTPSPYFYPPPTLFLAQHPFFPAVLISFTLLYYLPRPRHPPLLLPVPRPALVILIIPYFSSSLLLAPLLGPY